ncbi:AMP-binding protein [Nocardia sp. CDC159]|uniref:AMP-binding protein n=1 Tax=Nocardia pulmonis TaxID=2951408 RepID=A0A9X2E6I3_9NOCA|nr:MULTISPECIES: AMP-binding protein [Nocardia]MCM6774561.1 AMP-binding protein [Nocardia pulmonis]MCM6787374.1 AMP-binding protein [Nocardia sp. CDC159]
MSNESAGLWDRLFGGSARPRAALHCWTGTRFEGASWDEVVRDAERMTAGLRRAGVRSGTRVAAVLGNSPDTVRGLLAVWLAGGMVASLPMMARGMAPEEYADQLRTICDRLEPVFFAADDDLLAALPDTFGVRTRAWREFAGTGAIDAAPPADTDPAFVQFSSGSVGTPKGCVLTPAAMAAQLDIIADFIEPRPGDIWAGWLPLSHDMGLFGGLLNCLGHNIEAYLSTPLRFAFSPATWFADAARVGATMTVGSSSALHLAARASARHRASWPDGGLAATRICVIGAERVESTTLALATETFASVGLRPEAFMPAYGMAEATLAITATPMRELPRQLSFDAVALADGQLVEVSSDEPGAATVVSAGPACRGVSLLDTPATELGEIRVSTPSLAQGYWRDDERTARVFDGGILATGDLGFVRNGYLYPVGRTDDMISVAGRKVYAREIETAVETIPGVRRGCTTLVGVQDGPKFRLSLLVEAKPELADYAAVAEAAAALSMAKAAVAIDECVFLERDSLPKTPSGKIQRYRCQALIRAETFRPLATIRFDG